MLEIFFIFALLIGVFILFYRQAIEQYNILQIEGTQLSDLPKLLSERAPVVIREIGLPKLFTPESLKGNARLMQFPLSAKMTLGTYLQNPSVQTEFRISSLASQTLAQETGLHVWAEHTWFSRFFGNNLWEKIHTLSPEANVGNKGLRKTTAIYTMIYPTSSALDITLLTEQQQQFLPKVWRGRYPDKLTLQDTPLVGEIKYITIKLRPGNVLIVPTHWFVSIQASAEQEGKPILWSWMEIHNPISYIAAKMEGTVEAKN